MTLREINLIPEEILFRYKLKRRLYLWGLIFPAMILFVLGFHVYKMDAVLSQELPPSSLEGINISLISIIDQIGTVQEEIKKLDQHEDILKSISGRQAYSEIILRLINLVNRSTWLTRLEIADDTGNGHTINIDGYSIHSDNLGDFVERLSNEKIFSSVLLRYARNASQPDENRKFLATPGLIQFQIECKTTG